MSHRLLLNIFLILVFLILKPYPAFAATVNCINNCPDLAPGTTSGEWPMSGGNLQRTNWNTEAVRGMLGVEWYTDINARLIHNADPIVAGGKVFAATVKGLFAFDAVNGSVSWFYPTALPIGANPTFAGGIVYIPGFDRRIHAVNATDGKLKTGWTFSEAGAGFESNPLVVNNRVYAGNRDGYMYALDANTGALIWKWRDDTDEWPDAPIRFAPAYKNGVLYWGQDNARAYALNVSGSTPSLVWRSARLPGVGFASYWTALYHDKGTNKDYVTLSGSKKSTTGAWFNAAMAWNGGGDNYYQENYEIFSGISQGNLISATGNVAGDWAAGTVTLDAAKIQNYFNQKPQKRHFLVLDSSSGSEFTPYAPFNWVAVTHGGNKQPPVISGIDGVIYSFIGYQFGPDANTYPNMGASGCISGWKFGTATISRVCTVARGFADESVQYSGGGELIYWSEGFNMGYGSFAVNKPLDQNGQVEYASCASTWGCLGIPAGGGASAMIPSKDKLYMFDGSRLVAFSSNGAKRANPAASPSGSGVVPGPLSPQVVQARLEKEVNKILSAGPLRPGFHDSGFWSSAVSLGYQNPDWGYAGNHLAQYFITPADTITTLYQAAQILPQLKTQIVAYLKNNYGVGKLYDVTKVAHTGWKNGGAREIYPDTPEIAALVKGQGVNPSTVIFADPRSDYFNPVSGWPKPYTFPQDAFYGAWKYVQLVPEETNAVWNAIKGKIEPPIDSVNLTNSPYILNQYINGYIGYIELGKLAGASVSSQESTLNSLKSLRQSFSTANPFTVSYTRNLVEARHFMYMTPELADIIKSQNQSAIQTAVNSFSDNKPYWFVSKHDETAGEGIFEPLYTYHALFQAKARILNQSYTELVKYIDAPAFWRGDLFHIQNLIALLQAPGAGNISPGPTSPPVTSPPGGKPGDANSDNKVDGVDYVIWLNNYNLQASGASNGDFNGNGTVDGLDYVIWLNNYNQ